MARIRTIKPEFWHDEKLAPCDPLTRLTFLGLISMADDFGRLLDNERVINAFVFPETSDSVREPLANLSRMGRVRRGKTASGQRIIQIVNWERHQKVDKPQLKMAFPEIVEDTPLTDIRESFANDSRTDREPLAPHTTDLHTSDPDQRPVGTRKRAAHKADKKWPHFPDEARGRVLAAFRKIGEFPPGQIINAVGPYFRPAEAPEFVPHDVILLAVEDYCGLVTRGRSGPFAGPADLGKKLGALIRNCQTASRFDPVARMDAQMIAIHGSTKVAA